MLAHQIASLTKTLTLASPFLLLTAFLMSIRMRSDVRPKAAIAPAVTGAIFAGVLGLAVQDVPRDSLGLNVLILPFVACTWAFIGYCISWLAADLSSNNANPSRFLRWTFAASLLIAGGLLAANYGWLDRDDRWIPHMGD
jgi:urea transporter